LENKKITWRQALKRERGSHFSNDFTANYEAATKRMKAYYPGEYIIEEFYNGEEHCFDLRLKFASTEEETLFLLKYE
jgi:hypothetical protein